MDSPLRDLSFGVRVYNYWRLNTIPKHQLAVLVHPLVPDADQYLGEGVANSSRCDFSLTFEIFLLMLLFLVGN